MQLPALQSGNSGKFNNGDAPEVPGYTADEGRSCRPDGISEYSFETCPEECGCAFVLRENSCFCCYIPLQPLPDDQPFKLYTKNSCFTTTPAPNDPDPPGLVDGDPHIQTLDGVRYLLLKQGTFSLWHFSGFKTHVSPSKGIMQAFSVDW